MSEFVNLENYWRMYIESRDKEEREQIKQIIGKALKRIHFGEEVEKVEIVRDSNAIKYRYWYANVSRVLDGYFIFTHDFYNFNGLRFKREKE